MFYKKITLNIPVWLYIVYFDLANMFDAFPIGRVILRKFWEKSSYVGLMFFSTLALFSVFVFCLWIKCRRYPLNVLATFFIVFYANYDQLKISFNGLFINYSLVSATISFIAYYARDKSISPTITLQNFCFEYVIFSCTMLKVIDNTITEDMSKTTMTMWKNW